MTTAQVFEMPVTAPNSSFQNYTDPDNHIRQTTKNKVLYMDQGKVKIHKHVRKELSQETFITEKAPLAK